MPFKSNPIVAVVCITISLVVSANFARAQEVVLLNEDLDGWEVFTGVPHKSLASDDFPYPTAEKVTARKAKPIGLGDPLKIFNVEMEDGKPVLHISGKVYAGLTTLKSYSDYHLTFEYKWGEKKWEPRLEKKRDSGLLYHCTGKHGAFWNVWMRSLECQVQETDTGDLYTLAGTNGKNGTPENPRKSKKKTANHEVEGWNRVDVFTLGDKSVFAVNGHVVNRVYDATEKSYDQKKGEDVKWIPLTAGKIQIQSEGAEIFYRDIRLNPITELPTGDKIE